MLSTFSDVLINDSHPKRLNYRRRNGRARGVFASDNRIVSVSSSSSSFLLFRAAFDATLSHTGGQARKN